MALSYFFSSLADMVYKSILGIYSVSDVLFYRSLFSLPLIVLAARGVTTIKPINLHLHILRNLLAGIALFLSVYALSGTNLVAAKSLTYSSPLFAMIGASLFLGERLTFQKLASIVSCSVGVFLVLSPGTDAFSWFGVVAVVAALVQSSGFLLTRHMTSQEHPHSLMFSYAVVVLLMNAPFIDSFSSKILLFGLLLAVLHTIFFYLFLKALSMEEASKLAPLEYTGLIWLSISGYIFWGEIPTWIIMCGACLIVVGGLLPLVSSPFSKRKKD